MPVLDTGRKQLSAVIASGSGCQEKGIQKSYASIALKDAGNSTIAPMGLPVIWRDLVPAVGADPGPAADEIPAHWAIYTNQSMPTTNSPLPNGAAVCLVIGKDWAGDNRADVVLDDADATNLVVVYRDSAVKMVGIPFTGNAGTKTAFRLQLEKQDVVVIDSEADAEPSYEA